MAISKCASYRPYLRSDYMELEAEGEPVEKVSDFEYLRATILLSEALEPLTEIFLRNQWANGASSQHWKIWNGRTVKNPTKIQTYKAAVILILFHGAEVLIATKKEMKRFEAFVRPSREESWRFYGTSMFIVSNVEVLSRVGIKSIETFINAARLHWYGHVARMPDKRLPKFLLD